MATQMTRQEQLFGERDAEMATLRWAAEYPCTLSFAGYDGDLTGEYMVAPRIQSRGD